MKFNYKLQRLCGAYYGNPSVTDSFGNSSNHGKGSGANIVYTSNGNKLITAVSNRIQLIDLQSHTVKTLPIESRSNIKCLALSPNDKLLVVFDVLHYGMLINVHRNVVLHKWRIKHKVRQVQFSPNGQYLAVTCGKTIQIWLTPQFQQKTFAPMVLHRTYTGQTMDVVSITWSKDSSVILGTSRDSTARIWTVHTIKDYFPVTLSGHKSMVLNGYFTYNVDASIQYCFTISQDGALCTWEPKKKQISKNNDNNISSIPQEEEIDLPPHEDGMEDDDFQAQLDEAVDFFSGGTATAATTTSSSPAKKKVRMTDTSVDTAHFLVHTKWKAVARHYFHQGDVTSTCYSRDVLAMGFENGTFGIYEMPSVSNIHTLSIGSNQLIRASSLNNSGEWLALGCPKSQQLLVWEWKSETYILKQRGHAYSIRCMAYSPDGIVICTGGEDGKVKLWNSNSGFCYVTLDQSNNQQHHHNAPITAVTFANASVVLSASLDGTVRAHDLHRYRTFKTLTTPTPVQFTSLAVDPSGEVVTAGTMDPFHIYVWNLQTGKVLDVLTGHSGPVCGLSFSAIDSTLASASWDGTVQLWDIYKASASSERLQHTADVVCVTFRPDGKELCSATINGLLCFWNVQDAKLKFEIDGRLDIKGGRKLNDAVTVDNNAASRYFTSVTYSADGSCVLAGGNSKYVCIYEVSNQMLLKKFQVTHNRSLDGVLDEVAKYMTENGTVYDHVESDNEEDATNFGAFRLPGARRGDDGSRNSRIEVLTSQVAFSSTGREWSAVSGEGLHVYSLDEDMIFDPISLTEEITPSAVESKLEIHEFGIALRMALHLNEFALVQRVLEETPYKTIPHVVKVVGPEHLERLLQFLSTIVDKSPHVEFYVQWCLELLQAHGLYMEKHRGSLMRSFRALYKTIQIKHNDVKTMCDENKYTLLFVEQQARLNSK